MIIEGIQGVGGIQVPEVKFLKELSKACEEVDINGHMHNVSYIEAAYEVIPEDIYKNHEYSDIRVEYKKEIMENQEIKIRCIVFKNNGCLITMESENKLHAVIKLS